MPVRFNAWWALLLLAVLTCSTASPSAAARLQPVGDVAATQDKVYLDLDSVTTVGGLKIVSMVTLYPEPRVNNNGLLLDKHVQVTAFDCQGDRFIGIRTIGYLNGKPTGTGPELVDWRNKLKPIPDNALAINSLKLVCSGVQPPGVGPMIAGATPQAPTPLPVPARHGGMSSGSGIFVDADGYVLTNAHVINGCKLMAVKAFGGQPAQATLEAVDGKNDLALIKTRAGLGVPAPFRAQSRPARLGETIGVIGYPLMGILSNEPKATFGQINSVAGANNDYTLLQISAPVQPGNSGGPVYDESGLVVGVVVSELSTVMAAKLGVSPQNVNFAIRGEMAQIFMTAHGVSFSAKSPGWRLQTDEIAAAGEKSAAQIVCIKP